MKTKYITILIAFLIVTSMFSQSKLNNYKYVIVPNKYDFLKDKDQYKLNSLTQFLFEKYGFDALMEGDKYPEDLIRNRCLALKSDLIKDSGMFKTKLTIELKDCNDQVIYTSEIGESRDKEYEKAYNFALRNAFESIESLNYKYEPSAEIIETLTNTNLANNNVSNEIEKLKAEIESLKNAKEVKSVDEIFPDNVGDDIEKTNMPEMEKETLEVAVNEVPLGILYAQEIENGFQLVDSSPKVIYRIKKTGIEGVFLVENKNATLYKKGSDWILEYYENNVLKKEVLNIKF